MPKKLHHALTPLAVKSAKPGRYSDGEGLQLLVKESGARTWVYRFMLAGRTRDVGLGPAGGPSAVSLAKAREEAGKLRLKVKAGVDPLAERERGAAQEAAEAQAKAIAAVSFRAASESYIAAHEASWRNPKHRAQWRSTLATYAYPKVGDLPVAEIGTAEVMAVLEPIWKDKPETASRVRGRIESVLDAAKVKGLRSGENPARWRGHLNQVLPKRAKHTRGHHAAMAYAEVPTFMAQLREREALAARALEFTVLTAARSGETLGATWDEIDLAGAIWTVPAARMKASKEHRVPLSGRAVELLNEVLPLNARAQGSAPLFPAHTGRFLSIMAMAMLMRRMGRTETVHGFRSAFRDWAAESTSFPHEVCEMALAHAIGNKAEAAYRRGDLFDKRRKLMEAWSAYSASDGAARTTVLPIRKGLSA